MRKSLLILSFLFLLSASLPAQSKEVTTLRKKVKDLEKRIERLEKLILKKQRVPLYYDTTTIKKSNSKPLFADIHNWRRLEIGMKDTTVKRILGEPTRITAGKYTAIWWYEWRGSRQYKIGHVAFDNRKRLILWVEP